MADKHEQSRGLTVKLDVDVSEALTGLKAVQREAKKAAQALREVESQANTDKIESLRNAIEVQGADGNWNYNEYMRGMYNGMEFALSDMEDRRPDFREVPSEYAADKAVSSD